MWRPNAVLSRCCECTTKSSMSRMPHVSQVTYLAKYISSLRGLRGNAWWCRQHHEGSYQPKKGIGVHGGVAGGLVVDGGGGLVVVGGGGLVVVGGGGLVVVGGGGLVVVGGGGLVVVGGGGLVVVGGGGLVVVGGGMVVVGGGGFVCFH